MMLQTKTRLSTLSLQAASIWNECALRVEVNHPKFRPIAEGDQDREKHSKFFVQVLKIRTPFLGYADGTVDGWDRTVVVEGTMEREREVWSYCKRNNPE